MDNTSDLPDNQSLDNSTLDAGMTQRDAFTRRNVVIALWIIGLSILVAASAIVYTHPAPWSFDLQTTLTLQALQLPSWAITALGWVSITDNVIPSIISYVAWFIGLSLIGVIAWIRGKSPIPWFVTAIFVSVVPPVLNGLDGLIALIVGRPRPSARLVHVFMPVPVHSFPSGHVENDVVYYGFLLYLSLSKPVSLWRYRWVLIPFQIYAALNILFIGFSRVYEGSHWLTDVSGGYLSGALFLVLLIVLYRWTLDRMTAWYDKRQAKKSTQEMGLVN